MQKVNPDSGEKLYIQVYNQIRDAILAGDYPVGSKLPSEREFCQMFGVSRVPLREALCALELNGYVESFHGLGVFVRPRPAQIDFNWMRHVEPQEIIRARMVLEPDIAREAALHITDIDKQHLESITEGFRHHHSEVKDAQAVDREFHLCVAHASGSTLYDMLMTVIFETMEFEVWKHELGAIDDVTAYREANYREHQSIADAIIHGRPEEAYELMKAHIVNLYVRYWD